MSYIMQLMLEKTGGLELSLADLHGSVRVAAGAPRWRRWLRFIGPGYIIAVGYMDPGNWATDLAAGSAYGERLLFVVMLASVMAMVLQALCAWLGIAAGRDLAQLTRDAVSPPLAFLLWLCAQSSIIACDIAEVIGGAIALHLLFGLPMLAGALLTIADALLILALLRRGVRLLEAFVIAVCSLVALALLFEIALAHPAAGPIFGGLVPRPDLITHAGMLYIGVGIIGATVMPHNLYLHSALVQTRAVGIEPAARRRAIGAALVDSNVALIFAFLVNAAILVMAASIFFLHGQRGVQDLAGAYRLLSPILGGRIAPVIFALALLGCSLNATVTGTLAGQVVMEGMIRTRLPAAARRLATRGLAILPVILVLALSGPGAVNTLLVGSQVVLSLQLPFAMVPLMLFAGNGALLRGLRPPLWLLACGWAVTAAILVFNAALLRSFV